MSLSIIRPLCYGSNTANRFFLPSERSICRLNSRLTIHLLSLNTFWKVSTESSSRAVRTNASLGKSGQRISWDEAADAYFSDVSEKGSSSGKSAGESARDNKFGDVEGGSIRPGIRERSGSDSWERSEKEAFERRSRSTLNSTRTEGARSRESHSSGRESTAFPEGVKKWGSPATRGRKDWGGSSGYEGDRSGRAPRWQNSGFVDRDRRDVDKISSHGGERNGTEQWCKPARDFRKDSISGRSERDDRFRGKKSEYSRSEEYERGSEERLGFENDRRWQSREYTPPLQAEGEAVYGVAPIITALQVSRRKLYCLYMQENLRENIGSGKRKDKAAVSFIEKTAKSMGVAVKEASKHSLNMLVDNRAHQGLVLDASPLELVQVDMLDPPLYRDSKPPVWVALDEVTDPQNFGAILRSAYFLGAEGVVVCAKNSAPLSGVVCKASAGAMEVMEVHFCKNMMKFLDKCKENGWRVVGASADPASVPVRDLPHGIATILVLGNEGKGLRTNVRRACDLLVSIRGISNGHQKPKNDFTDFMTQDQDVEEVGLDPEEDETEGTRRGAELDLMSGPLAVDSLNVSVAAGIMLYELLGSPMEKDVDMSRS